ncbi:MAG: YfcE family phosphodiesterase [Ruminococcus sp.]|nr:YfcE family phosphodiesterase [Ruminococcus sp.]
MRIIVISDTHGNYRALEKIVSAHINTADIFIHLGDGRREIDRILMTYPEIENRFMIIDGNCDLGSIDGSPFIITHADGHNIFAVHGHRQGVKYSLDDLKECAKANECDIVLYGHTHQRYNSYQDGMYIMNPGSASCPRDSFSPSYGIIDSSEKGVVMNIAEVNTL